MYVGWCTRAKYILSAFMRRSAARNARECRSHHMLLFMYAHAQWLHNACDEEDDYLELLLQQIIVYEGPRLIVIYDTFEGAS